MMYMKGEYYVHVYGNRHFSIGEALHLASIVSGVKLHISSLNEFFAD